MWDLISLTRGKYVSPALGAQSPSHWTTKEFQVPHFKEGFPGGSADEEPACLCRRCKRCRFNLWFRKISWRRIWQLAPVFLPGKLHEQRSLIGYTVCSVAKSQTWQSAHTFLKINCSWHFSLSLFSISSESLYIWEKQIRCPLMQEDCTSPHSFPPCSQIYSYSCCISHCSVYSVMFDSLWPHGLQHTRLPCPSPSPGACSNSCPLSRWSHPTILSSVVPFFFCFQSFPESGSFLMSWLFASGDQSIVASAPYLIAQVIL